MTDIVEKLRTMSAPPYDSAIFGGPMLEAADKIERLREALEPFAKYAHDQLNYRLPKAIVNDDSTPVWGNEYSGEATIDVGDLRRVAEASPDLSVAEASSEREKS